MQRLPDTSTYVQGVEVPKTFDNPIPDGYDMLGLSPCKMMVFQGPPFEDEEFGTAITSLRDCMKTYQPELYGYAWAYEDAHRCER
jgi:hypothetical protein